MDGKLTETEREKMRRALLKYCLERYAARRTTWDPESAALALGVSVEEFQKFLRLELAAAKLLQKQQAA